MFSQSDAALAEPWAGARRPHLVGALALFLVLAACYSFSVGLRATRAAAITGDEPFYLMTTQSLLDDGDLDLRQQYDQRSYTEYFDHPNGLWKQSTPLADGSILSPHEPGLSVLVMPGFVIGGLRGVQAELMLLAAATFALAFILAALETNSLRVSWAVTAVVGLAAPAFVYSTEIYPEMPAALCLVVALLLLRSRCRGVTGAITMALVLSALAWLGMKYVPLGAIVGVAYLWRGGRQERTWFCGLTLVSAAVYGWWHLAVFGALTAYNSNTVYEGASTVAVLESHVAFQERFYRIWGLFIDRRFGIGRWAPIFLAVLPALPLLRRAKNGPVIAAVIVAQVLIATFVAITMMGWWFPGRMLMIVYPLFAVVLSLAAVRLPNWARIVAGAAGAYSLAVAATLWHGVANGPYRLAFDPFEMQAPIFRVAGRFLPQYTSWGRETVVLNTAWLTIGIAALVLVAWFEFGPSPARIREFSRAKRQRPAARLSARRNQP